MKKRNSMFKKIVLALKGLMKARSLKSIQVTVTRKIDSKTGFEDFDVSWQASDTQVKYDPEKKQMRMIERKLSSSEVESLQCG